MHPLAKAPSDQERGIERLAYRRRDGHRERVVGTGVDGEATGKHTYMDHAVASEAGQNRAVGIEEQASHRPAACRDLRGCRSYPKNSHERGQRV